MNWRAGWRRARRELGVATPTIETALEPREAAARERRYELALTPSRQPMGRAGEDPESVLEELHGALYTAVIITYAEGLALLAAAAEQQGFDFQPGEILRVWKGCNPIGSTFLEDMAAAFRETPDLPNLLCDAELSEKVMAARNICGTPSGGPMSWTSSRPECWRGAGIAGLAQRSVVAGESGPRPAAGAGGPSAVRLRTRG